MNSCLADKRLLLQGAKEKVWAAFHQSLQSRVSAITDITGSRPASSTLCLRVMMALVDANYTMKTPPQTTSEELTERDGEIVAYIAGFLLKKLRSRPEARFLVDNSSEPSGLIAVKSRFGLIQPKEEFVSVVLEMEKVFRAMPIKNVNRDEFHENIYTKDIHSLFFDTLDNLDVDVESKEDFFIRLSNVFFTVRAHQKCRHIVDTYTKATNTNRRSKALRDSI